jgi:hypothetical protein
LLAVHVAFLSGFAIPAESFGIVSGNSETILIHPTDAALPDGEPLVRRLLVPDRRLGVVLLHAETIIVKEA